MHGEYKEEIRFTIVIFFLVALAVSLFFMPPVNAYDQVNQTQIDKIYTVPEYVFNNSEAKIGDDFVTGHLYTFTRIEGYDVLISLLFLISILLIVLNFLIAVMVFKLYFVKRRSL